MSDRELTLVTEILAVVARLNARPRGPAAASTAHRARDRALAAGLVRSRSRPTTAC